MAPGPYKLQRISLLNVSCYLIYRKDGAILVDCGNRGSEHKILSQMGQLGLEPGMLRLLVLTHVHFDHAGSAHRLKSATGCRVMVHRSEADRLQKGITPIPGGTRWKAKAVVTFGRLFRPGFMKFPGVTPDILVDEGCSLEEFGFQGYVHHTPGHTPGSVVVLMERGELIAGDTLFGVEGKQHFPPFAEDLPSLVQSWQKIRNMPVRHIYPAHGRAFSISGFMEEYEAALKRYGSARR